VSDWAQAPVRQAQETAAAIAPREK
jgi:hypothetical protein